MLIIASALALGYLSIKSASSVGVQIKVESSQIRLGQVPTKWQFRNSPDSSSSLNAGSYIDITRLDSFMNEPVKRTGEKLRFYANRPAFTNGRSFVGLKKLSFANGPAQVKLECSPNDVKLILQSSNAQVTEPLLRIYGEFEAPTGFIEYADGAKETVTDAHFLNTVFYSQGMDPTEWTFSSSDNKQRAGLLQFTWIDIPVTDQISFDEVITPNGGWGGNSTIRHGSIRIYETGQEVELYPRDALNITIDKSEEVSVDVTCRNQILYTTITGRIIGFQAGRSAYPVHFPSVLEKLINSREIIAIAAISTTLITLLLAFYQTKRT